MKTSLRLPRTLLQASKASASAFVLASGMCLVPLCSVALAENALAERRPVPWRGPCSPTETTLCLNDGRFSVAVSWRVPDQGRSGQGTAAPLRGDTGLFWFFDDSNIELVVKVLDGTPVNGSYWVFYAGLSEVEYTITVIDLENGRVRTYDNQSGSFASVADTSAFPDVPGRTTVPDGIAAAALETRSSRELYALFEGLSQKSRPEPRAASPCTAGDATLCLAGSRFQLTVDWEIPGQGRSGHGSAVPISADTGYFWFFDDANVELAVKVLDGRPINGHFWIFAAALSNVKYTLTMTDTQTGQTKSWENPDGRLASWADTGSFSDSFSPAPPPQGLSGTWSGTIRFVHWINSQTPPSDWPATCLGSAPIVAVLMDSGSNLTAQFETSCGIFTFQGTHPGASISGFLDTPDGRGTISIGRVSDNRIQFQATVNIHYDHDSDADDLVVDEVDLSRP